MNSQPVAGIVLLVVGVILFVVGMNASDSPADRWSNFFTGHFNDATVWYLIGGVALAAVGLMIVPWGRRTSRSCLSRAEGCAERMGICHTGFSPSADVAAILASLCARTYRSPAVSWASVRYPDGASGYRVTHPPVAARRAGARTQQASVYVCLLAAALTVVQLGSAVAHEAHRD